MTLKSFMPVLAAGLFFLGACTPEKQSDNEELTESRTEALAEQKLATGKRVYDANWQAAMMQAWLAHRNLATMMYGKNA